MVHSNNKQTNEVVRLTSEVVSGKFSFIHRRAVTQVKQSEVEEFICYNQFQIDIIHQVFVNYDSVIANTEI